MTRHIRITKALGLNKIDLRSVSKWKKEASEVNRKSCREFLSTLPHEKNDMVDKRVLVVKVDSLLNAAPDQSLFLHLFKPAVTGLKLSRPDGAEWRTERDIIKLLGGHGSKGKMSGVI